MIEPLKNADPAELDPVFRRQQELVLADLLTVGKPFRMIEGRRTADRCAWLFGSSRPLYPVWGRPGPWLTNKDGQPGVWPKGSPLVPSSEWGKTRASNHQDGKAGDYWPVDSSGRVFCPRGDDPIWIVLALVGERYGLTAGLRWRPHPDADHLELKGDL